ncbi:MAG: KipI antagonist [Acidobacteria bacterium]|nr:MAG: KipI antagonist [Acidobacteriota bacterium]
MTDALLVARAGMLTTVQDCGRWGYQGVGVPVAGPMDWYSHALANRLVGNAPNAAALEVTLIGPELIVEGQVVCAMAGADFEVTIGGGVVPAHQPFTARGGSRVRIGARRAGARASLAVRGGFDVPLTFGSRATHLVSRMGPFDGRALRAGDRLPIGSADQESIGDAGIPLEMPRGGARVRVVPAAHRERFTDEAWRALTSARFIVTPQSDRMGYRLEGPVLAHVRGADILSEAMPIGAMQVPSSGQPILLMADRQTTGGYATIANVITADLPLAGQLAPGDWIEFSACTHGDAIGALRARHASLAGART